MMDIRIGNIIGLLLSCIVFAHAVDSIELQLTDMNGKAIDRIGVGQSALIKVRITGSPNESVSIPGLDQFYHEQRGSYKTMYSINGKQTHTIDYEYLIRAQHAGIFKVGPVKLDGLKSNKLIVRVKPHITRTRATEDEVLLECLPKVVYGVPGQKIPLSISIDATEAVRNIQLQPPAIKNDVFTLSNMNKTCDQMRVIDGKKRKHVECTVDLTVHKAGRWMLPEFSCIAQLPRQSRVFGPLISHMGFGMLEKIFYANPVQIIVEPLPETDEPLDGIGEFSRYVASIDKDEVSLGQGCILTLELTGNGNFEAINAPILQLPDGLKYYESKTEVKTNTHDRSKCFEYVVQGLTPGTMNIDPQQFCYFDTEKRSVQTLATKPLSLTIRPGESTKAVVGEDQEDVRDSSLLQIHEQGPWYPKREPAIPSRWFFLLTLIPLIVGSTVGGYRWWRRYYLQHFDYYRKKNAYKNALKRLKNIKKYKTPKKLYELFVTYFSDKFNCPKSICTQAMIEQHLVDAGLQGEALEQWKSFWYYLTASSFADIPQEEFLQRAEVWLSQLEGIL